MKACYIECPAGCLWLSCAMIGLAFTAPGLSSHDPDVLRMRASMRVYSYGMRDKVMIRWISICLLAS